MKQRARGITGHVQIRKAVVIEIADRNSHSIKSQTIYPGLRRHILKLSIPEVVIERIANGNCALAMRRLATVHEEDVLYSVTVDIEARHASSPGFHQIAVWSCTAKLLTSSPGV